MNDLPDWYLQKMAYRALIFLRGEKRTLPAVSAPDPVEVIEALQVAAELRRVGMLN
jgi:hypothetical protein